MKSGLLGVSERGGWRQGGGWKVEELLTGELMAQVEWKGMCLDIRGMIVAPSDDMGPSVWFEMPQQRRTEPFVLS